MKDLSLRKETGIALLWGITEYFDMGHAEVVPNKDLRKPEAMTYYLPMHGVAKESSTTTKLHIFFDASATTSNGISLNDTLLVGPNIYNNLTDIIICFPYSSNCLVC